MKKTQLNFNCFPSELILHIVSFLDNFQKIQFALSSKTYYHLIYSKSLQDSVKSALFEIKQLKQQMHIYIKRINTDGVVYGECEQCFQKKLLYTHNDGFVEKTICIENCESYCIYCFNTVSYHIIDKGCPVCRMSLIPYYYDYSSQLVY